MEVRKSTRKIDKTLLVLVALVLIAVTIAFLTGGGQLALAGLRQAGRLAGTIWFRLILGFTLGGLIQVLVPRALIARWLGPASGLKGILIGSYTGMLMSGGPYVFLPIIASIYRAGAGVGPVIALLAGRSLLGIEMLIVWQMPFFGIQLPLARFIASLLLPPLIGLAGKAVYQAVTRTDEAIAAGEEKNAESKHAAEPDKPGTMPEQEDGKWT
ncbi:MAG: permease [Dehalococcoidales bacterium]|nr:permease [Dehalococcoidales bacterium]